MYISYLFIIFVEQFKNNTTMKASECELNEMYRSKNPLAIDCKYQVVKMNKTTCWVKLIENNEPTEYKNVPYSVLIKK